VRLKNASYYNAPNKKDEAHCLVLHKNKVEERD